MEQDGTLRWIITPRRGKVYFLSPVTSTEKINHDYSKILNSPKLNIRNVQFNPKGDFAYISRFHNKEQFFVNDKIKSPINHQGLGPCIIDKRGRAILQIKINTIDILLLENLKVSNNKAEEIGAWQVDPAGNVILAQKIGGKWGIYKNNEQISPDCKMVWGWQITNDNKFIVPVEYNKGNNLVLLIDNEKVYGGEGNLLTWHYENKNLWVLAIEDKNYCFYKNQELIQKNPLNKGTLVKWKVENENITAEFTQRKFSETPRTCHPELEYVASNEWWF